MAPYYQDAAITLYHGNCLEVLASVAPFCDHLITDPPYGRDVYLRASMPMTKTGSRTPIRIGAALTKLATGDIGCIDELMDPVALLVGALVKRWAIVFSDVESLEKWRTALVRGSLRYVRTGAWVKPDAMPQMSGDRPAVGFEPATICHAQGPMHWNGGGHAAVWTHGTTKVDRPDHPCPKPEPLMRELVELFTDPDETILDPFAGSGTTGVAAKRLGRKCILIEKEERYCEVAARRLAQGALDLDYGAKAEHDAHGMTVLCGPAPAVPPLAKVEA